MSVVSMKDLKYATADGFNHLARLPCFESLSNTLLMSYDLKIT